MSNSRPVKQDLAEIHWALNAYRSAQAEAQGYISGVRVYNLKAAQARLQALLWEHREAIAAWAKEEDL